MLYKGQNQRPEILGRISIMSVQLRKQPENVTTSSSSKFIGRHPGALLMVLPLMLSMLFVTAARATTLLDPQPEDATTRFTQSVAVSGDITGDGVPHLVAGAPLHASKVTGTGW